MAARPLSAKIPPKAVAAFNKWRRSKKPVMFMLTLLLMMLPSWSGLTSASLRFARARAARHNGAQPSAQLRSLLAAIRTFKLLLRLGPHFMTPLKPRLACSGQAQNPAAPVRRIRFDYDQAVAFERAHVATQRRAIHDQLGRERIYRHRALPLEFGENSVLRGSQARCGHEILIVELRDIAGRLADSEAVALRGINSVLLGHWGSHMSAIMTILHFGCICAYVNAQAAGKRAHRARSDRGTRVNCGKSWMVHHASSANLYVRSGIDLSGLCRLTNSRAPLHARI